MKSTLFFIVFLLYQNLKPQIVNNEFNQMMNFVEITNQLSFSEFEKIKEFTLKKGNRKTYRNYDGNNPHYNFTDFDIFFGADIGQRNINNDPSISDFNELTIADWDADIIYYTIIIVRKGDIEKEKYHIQPRMEEGKVYLVGYEHNLDVMKKNLSKYLTIIKKEVIKS